MSEQAYRPYLSASANNIRPKTRFAINRELLTGGIGIIAALVVLFALVNGAAKLGGTLGTQPDPFAVYKAILPGEPSNALASYPCHLEGTPYHTICEITAGEELFQTIMVTFQDGRIQDLLFRGGDSYKVGDLVLRWGTPDTIEKREESFLLQWESGVSAIVASDDRFHHLLPVQSLWMSGASGQQTP
jgi:hypothetical protein